MSKRAPSEPQSSPTPSPTAPRTVSHAGHDYPLLWEPSGWRLRSKSKTHPADFRTGKTNLALAKTAAKEWLRRHDDDPALGPKKGGGTLERMADIYVKSDNKRVRPNTAKDNLSRLRTICRAVYGKELVHVTCRQLGPEFWKQYQKAALERHGLPFSYSTRYRENIAINAQVKNAKSLLTDVLIREYRANGLDVPEDAGVCAHLAEPKLPPVKVDDVEIVKLWSELEGVDIRLWLAIGLARFAGLRRTEIQFARVGWIERKDEHVTILLRDRQEEKFWTKTGETYRARVIDPKLAEYLEALAQLHPPEAYIVPDPTTGNERERWFQRVPQKWVHDRGVAAKKPLHRLRGLYADHLAKLTEDEVAARLAGIRAAKEALGHTSSKTTERHYLTPDALR